MVIKIRETIINLSNVRFVSISHEHSRKKLLIYVDSKNAITFDMDDEAQRFYDWYSNVAKSFDKPLVPRYDRWEYEA